MRTNTSDNEESAGMLSYRSNLLESKNPRYSKLSQKQLTAVNQSQLSKKASDMANIYDRDEQNYSSNKVVN